MMKMVNFRKFFFFTIVPDQWSLEEHQSKHTRHYSIILIYIVMRYNTYVFQYSIVSAKKNCSRIIYTLHIILRLSFLLYYKIFLINEPSPAELILIINLEQPPYLRSETWVLLMAMSFSETDRMQQLTRGENCNYSHTHIVQHTTSVTKQEDRLILGKEQQQYSQTLI